MILPDACRVNIQPVRKACSISAESLLNLCGIRAQFRRFGCAISVAYAEDGVLVIDKERADVVKNIYRLYLDGSSILGIKRSLEEMHILSPSGNNTWSLRTIDLILSNEKYIGKIVLFKTIMVNYPYSVRRSNANGALHEQYCMTNGVDAIIDEQTFLAVQEEKKRRSNYDEDESGRHRRKTRYSSKKV